MGFVGFWLFALDGYGFTASWYDYLKKYLIGSEHEKDPWHHDTTVYRG
jgi:hypothetical protein